MLKIAIASLFSKSKKYATALKIQGAQGGLYDGYQFYNW